MRLSKADKEREARRLTLTRAERLEECRRAWETGVSADAYASRPCTVILWNDDPAIRNRGWYLCIKHDVVVADHTVEICSAGMEPDYSSHISGRAFLGLKETDR